MRDTERKTALAFHAKDDLPEIRREMFRLLPTFGVKFFAAFRRKNILAEEFRTHYRVTHRKLTQHTTYDELVARLLRDKLHSVDETRIVFAQRGSFDRTAAFSGAIANARSHFARHHRVARRNGHHPTHISSAYPHQAPGLQVVDYYLWTLQRTLETGESRFFNLLRQDVRLVIDIDDIRNQRAGEYYTAANPIGLQKLLPIVIG